MEEMRAGLRSPHNKTSTSLRLAVGAGLLAVLLLSLAMRSLLAGQVFQGGKTYFFGTDPYYHMRRILLTLSDYPHVPAFDFYANFPSGAWINWPGGFDFLLATIALILAKGQPSVAFTERVCAASIPVLGALTVWAFYLLARHFLPAGKALFGSLLLALSGSHILVSRIGRVDHHVLEVLLPCVAYLLYLRSFSAPTARQRIRNSVLCGMAFGLSFAVWTGSVMYLGIFVLYLFSQQASFAARGKVPVHFEQTGTLVLLTTALVLLPISATSPWGKQGHVTYLALSWFHFLIPAYSLIVFFLLNRLVKPSRAGMKGLLRHILALLAISFGLLAATGFLHTEFTQTLREAWEFLARKETQIHTVAESRSPFAVGSSARRILYGPFPWFLPVLAGYGFIRSLRAGSQESGTPLLLIWFLTVGILATLQIRFAPAFSLPVCLFLTFLLEDVGKLLNWIGKRRSKPGLYRWIGLPLYVSTGLAFLPIALDQPDQRSIPEFLSAFEDIRKVTPETSSCWTPSQKPEYAVLAHWSYGHFLNYLSHRPNVSNPFGQAEWYLKGVRESYRFLLAEDEADAAAICTALEARYVLVASISSSQSTFSRFLAFLHPDRLHGVDPLDYLRLHYCALMNNRMLLGDGIADPSLPQPREALEQFRLVYESRNTCKDRITQTETSFFKLFEFVRGARLEGRALPSEILHLELPVETNLGRRFLYTRRIVAGEQGDFVATLPYSTRGNPHPSGPEEPWRIRFRGVSTLVSVDEKAVREGEVVPVDLSGNEAQ